MNADEILVRTFAEHEGETPDPEVVLADVHARLARRRRTVPILAAAATVAAIAIGASVVAGQRSTPAPPASTPTPTPTGANRTPSQPGPTPVDPLSALPAAAAAQATVGVDTTWLPPGTVKRTELAVFYGRQTRVYEITGPAGAPTYVELRLWTGSSLTPDQFLDASPHDLTLGGRAAREWAGSDLYVIVLRAPGGRVAQVNVFRPGDAARADLAATGRRIATSLRLDRAEPVRPEFRPTYVPKGLVVRSVGVRDLDGTSWALAAPHADPAGPYVALGLDKRTSSNSTVPGPMVSARPVRGHPAHVITDGDQISLWVDGLVRGKTLTVTTTRNLIPVAELYRIAEGVR